MTAADTQVFVYGSLLSGLHNHYLLEGAIFLGPASTQPAFQLFDLGPHPAAVCATPFNGQESEGGYALRGEVYSVSESTLGQLDLLEAHPSYYRREVIELQNGASAWIYLLPQAPPGRPEVVTGDWRAYLDQRLNRPSG